MGDAYVLIDFDGIGGTTSGFLIVRFYQFKR